MSEARIGILMGSDSDWPVMEEAAKTCDQFGVACEVRVLSAHRRPDDCAEYARSARQRGLRVLIGGAGGAAHLAGGLDSLLSMVQMPPGVPVATVAVGRAGNAALLALQMLALADDPLAERLAAYKRELAAKGEAADRKVQAARSGA